MGEARTFRKLLPNTRLQMLLRGQNMLGYRHYEDGVVQRFVEKSAENGMDVFRVFDALNDIRNMATALKAVKASGKHAQGTICYTLSPEHTVEDFVRLAEDLMQQGVDSICIKDMAALLKPQPAYDLVKGIKRACGDNTLVHVHVHATTGVTLVSLMKAIEGERGHCGHLERAQPGSTTTPRRAGGDAGRHGLHHALEDGSRRSRE